MCDMRNDSIPFNMTEFQHELTDFRGVSRTLSHVLGQLRETPVSLLRFRFKHTDSRVLEFQFAVYTSAVAEIVRLALARRRGANLNHNRPRPQLSLTPILKRISQLAIQTPEDDARRKSSLGGAGISRA